MNVERPARGIRFPWQETVVEKDRNDTDTILSRRVPLVGFMSIGAKNHFIAMMSEFVGTFMFLLFAFGGTNVVNTAPKDPNVPLNADPSKLMYIAVCFGMSLAVNAWVFFRISGGLFNPAVTIGMMLVGGVTYVRGALVMVSQVLGGIAASAVVLAIFPGPLNVRTELGGGTTVLQGLLIEMFLTAQLVFTIFMLAAEKHRATFIAPLGIGLSLFIAELMGVFYTGGSVNPARSFGPDVVLGQFDNYAWIYWAGPILGSLIATGFYLLVKALEYETVNPDQDTNGEVRVAFDPNSGAEKRINTNRTVMVVNPSGWHKMDSPNATTDVFSRAEMGEMDSQRTLTHEEAIAIADTKEAVNVFSSTAMGRGSLDSSRPNSVRASADLAVGAKRPMSVV